MSDPTYAEFQRRALSLYQPGGYAEALDFVTCNLAVFPAEAKDWRFFRASAAALAGQPDVAIGCLREIVDDGGWIVEAVLRNAELKSLQGLAAFEEIVATCKERYEKAQADSRPVLLTYPPQRRLTPGPALLVCHGHRSNAKLTAPAWMEAVHQGWTLAVAQSSQLAAPDEYTWWDDARAMAEVADHYTKLAAQSAIDGRRIVLAGFSQGGGLCIRLALQDSQVSGFLAVCPGIRDLEAVLRQVEEKEGPSLRGYFVLGGADVRCTEPARRIAAAMRERSMACEVEEHPGMSHQLPPDFSGSMVRALRFLDGAAGA